MPTFAFCGTDDAAVVRLEMSVDGKFEQMQRLELPNPRNLPKGSPGGISVEWIVAHPAGKHAYALLSSWDHAPGELFTLDVGDDDPSNGEGELAIAPSGPVPSGGYQPCHAVLSGSDYMLVAHYLSADVAVFNISVTKGHAGKPVRVAKATLPRRGPLPAWVVTAQVAASEPPPPSANTSAAGEGNKSEEADPEARGFRAPEPGEFAPLCHGLALEPDGDYLVACDAGAAF